MLSPTLAAFRSCGGFFMKGETPLGWERGLLMVQGTRCEFAVFSNSFLSIMR